MADTVTEQLFELWKKQLEEGTRAWARLVTQAPVPPADPTTFFRPVIEQGLEAWARLFSQTPVTPDLMGQWKQFLDQWIEAWSRVLGQVMGTEAFAQTLGRSLDQWLAAQGPVRKASEQTLEAALGALNLPSRAQVTALAKQLVELEERLERIEDAIGALARRGSPTAG